MNRLVRDSTQSRLAYADAVDDDGDDDAADADDDDDDDDTYDESAPSIVPTSRTVTLASCKAKHNKE